MGNLQKIDEKIFQYLIHLMDSTETAKIHDFLVHSDIYTQPDFSSSWQGAIGLTIVTHPDTYKEHNIELNDIKKSITKKLTEFSQIIITSIRVIPDLRKFQILNNRYSPVNTPWEEINNYQNILLEQLRTASEPIEYQNIGNTGRTIMQKISNLVFNPLIHKAPENVDLTEGRFKNRLHTYIKSTLGGADNKEIRDYALSVVDTAESSIDLANKLTHSLNADSFIAESCVISTISAINLIKIIVEKNERETKKE